MAEKSALEGLRVVDFSNMRAGAQASQTLADFGADVIHVEPQGGSSLRAETAWPMWGRGKRSIQLDLKNPADRETARQLALGADVVLESWRPGVAERLGLGYDELSKKNPRLVYTSITGFGRTGPLASLQGYEGVVIAKMGVNWSLHDLTTREGPSFCTAMYASYPASQLAIQGIVAALIDRERTGLGQRADTSLLQGLTVHDTYQWFTRVVSQKFSGGMAQAPRVRNGIPTGSLSFRLLIALTKDGQWLQFSQTTQRLFAAMVKMFGLDWMWEDPRWKTLPEFDDEGDREEFWEILLGVVRTKTAAEWLEEFHRDPNVWGEEYRKGGQVLDHPQSNWNRMVNACDDRDAGELRTPAAIARMDGTPADCSRPAPRLGEHDAAIRAEANKPAAAASGAVNAASGVYPLEGVTIVELGAYYAAPYAATLMAELGARVIKLEPLDGDPQRIMLPFPEVAGLKALQGKECVAVDLQSEKGRAIAYKIIAEADIVLQSFRAGAAKRLGLDHDTLLKLNPNLVYHAAPGYGEDGPYGHRPAFAPTIGAGAGLAWRQAGHVVPQGDLTMEEIKPASMLLGSAVMGVGNADGISAVTAASAMLIALYARNRGLGGQHLLTTMLSSVSHSIAEVAVEYEGRPAPMTADSELYGFGALYRLYPTAEEWVFLAAPSDREWARLTKALPGGDRLAADARFADAESRKRHDEALAKELGAIFSARKGAEWEADLRKADIACVVAAQAPVEAHYMDEGGVGEQCGMVTKAHHPILDEIPRLAPLVRFSRSATIAGDAGLCGQHTNKVLADYGYSEADLAALAADNIIMQN